MEPSVDVLNRPNTPTSVGENTCDHPQGTQVKGISGHKLSNRTENNGDRWTNRNYNSRLPANPSKLLKTALATIDGYNAWSIEAIAAPRTKDCTQQVFPESLKGQQYKTPEEYCNYYKDMLYQFEDFRMEVVDYCEDQTQNKVFFHAKCTASTDAGSYNNEFVWMMRMTEDQEKVCDIKEFIDSGYTLAYLKAMWDRTGYDGKKTWWD